MIAPSNGNLNAFLDLFEKWNRRINLSAASTRSELEEHLMDSLHAVPHLQGRARVLDVGSGGGFPVVPAAICCPGTRFTALEPVHKKHAFLRTAARELGLHNLEPLAERIEDHSTRDYDTAMSRATFDIVEWMMLGATMVSDGGIVIGFEGTLRRDLPPSITRTPYVLSNKSRSIVTFHVKR